MIRLLTLTALMSAAFLGTVLPAAAQSSGELRFAYDPDDGYLYATVALNRRSARNCTMTLRGGVHYEGSTVVAFDRVLFRHRFKRKDLLEYELDQMPGVANAADGARPILTLQARVSCRGSRPVNLITTPFARYVNCGATVRKVAPRKFLRVLRSRLLGQDGDLT